MQSELKLKQKALEVVSSAIDYVVKHGALWQRGATVVAREFWEDAHKDGTKERQQLAQWGEKYQTAVDARVIELRQKRESSIKEELLSVWCRGRHMDRFLLDSLVIGEETLSVLLQKTMDEAGWIVIASATNEAATESRDYQEVDFMDALAAFLGAQKKMTELAEKEA